ncbi:MAG: hypothetical protein H6739_28315 [Alphaproteobacteria bacterium]|nr:hypothetical protein [Alphaproteobacteria bacterium]
MNRPFRLLLLLGLAAACTPKSGSPKAGGDKDDVIVVENPDVTYEPIEGEGDAEAEGAFTLPDWAADVPQEGALVRLIEPGAEPLETLRFAPASGHTETMRMVMDMDMTMDVGGMTMPMMMPVMVMDMDIEVTEVDEAGDIHYNAAVSRFVVEDKEGAMEGLAAQLEAEMQGMVGLRGDMVVSNTGEARSAGFTAPPDAPDTVKQQLQSINQNANNMAVPLPEEPVGVGARWEVLKRTSSNGMEVVERSEIHLASREGDAVTLESTVEQHLANPDLQLPGMPPGAQVELVSFSSNGSTTSAMVLSNLAPDKADGKVTLDMAMNVDAGAGMQPMTMHLDLGLEMLHPEDE